MEIVKNYINGKLVTSPHTDYMEIEEPASGVVYGTLPISTSKEVDLAVNAASKAFVTWSNLSPAVRSEWLLKIAEGIEQNLEELSIAESKDTGKPISLARELDIPRAAANFRFFAGAVLHGSTQAHHTTNQIMNYTNRIPLGAVACISPWNLPLYLFTWKIAPALAVGNCVVAKPSELSPYTAYLLSRICIEIGLPAGVLNIVHGPGDPVGKAMVVHKSIKAISFTGGTVTGREIASTAAPLFKKVSLELGGKNPNIVFQDCDFQLAVRETVRSAFTNQGQICLCGSRVFIQKGIYSSFRDALIEEVKKLTPSDPSSQDSNFGALISKEHLKKVLGYVDLAKDEGGKVLIGGEQVVLEGRCESGYFMQPTIIEGLPQNCRTNQEEIFGPVITLMPFEDENEVISKANDVPYGLSATIWTSQLSKAHRVASSLHSGVIWINCWLIRDLRTPFGGMKNSGIGREGGEEALKFFTEAQNVCIKL